MTSPDIPAESKPRILWDALALALCSGAATVFFSLLLFVLPGFRSMFIEMAIELPLPTKLALFLAVICRNYWFAAVPLAVLVLAAPLLLGAGRARWAYLAGSILLLILSLLMIIAIFLPLVNMTNTLSKRQ